MFILLDFLVVVVAGGTEMLLPDAHQCPHTSGGAGRHACQQACHRGDYRAKVWGWVWVRGRGHRIEVKGRGVWCGGEGATGLR